MPGVLGARYSALAAGRPVPTPRTVRIFQDRLVASPQLDHLIGANQFFTDLAHRARAHPAHRLACWWSAEHTAAVFAGRIHPDGYGIWETSPDGDHRPHDQDSDRSSGPGGLEQDDDLLHDGTRTPSRSSVGFWLEYDTGSESLSRLVRKLDAYQRLLEQAGPDHPVLFWLPTRRRQDHLHRLLAEVPTVYRVTIATGVHTPPTADSPAAAVWRYRHPSGDEQDGLRLQDLSIGQTPRR